MSWTEPAANRRQMIYRLERTACIHVEGDLWRVASREEAEAIVDGNLRLDVQLAAIDRALNGVQP